MNSTAPIAKKLPRFTALSKLNQTSQDHNLGTTVLCSEAIPSDAFADADQGLYSYSTAKVVNHDDFVFEEVGL